MIKKITLVLFALFLAGCTPIFIKEDKPIVLNNTTGQTTLQGSSGEIDNVTIKNINDNLTDGLVYDMSKDGKDLLIGNLSDTITTNITSAGSSLNMHLYNVKSNQLKQILTSSKEQVNGLMDNNNDGMLYVEYKEDDDGKPIPNSYTLNWSNTVGTMTKSISDPDESVSEKFYITNNTLIYGNSNGEIKLMDIDTIDEENIYPKTYQLDTEEPLSITKIQYHSELNEAIFLVKNSESNSTDLYHVRLEKYLLNPILIEKNVSDFDLAQDRKGILYCISGEKNKLVYLEMLQLVPEKDILYEGAVKFFSFSPDEKEIIFSEKIDSSSNTQNLWIMNSDGNELKQVASNLKITGNRIIFHPNKNIIYFSVYDIDEENPKDFIYKVYKIEYAY
ncbi:MAG: hypothetical protein ACOWWR_07520 [Eubacteriales bacterium]